MAYYLGLPDFSADFSPFKCRVSDIETRYSGYSILRFHPCSPSLSILKFEV